MTLRARLSVAFAGLLLGPLLLAVAALVVAVPRADPGGPRAGEAVRAVVAARCDHLEIVAESLATTASARGQSWAVSPTNAEGPWALCGVDPTATDLPAVDGYTGLAARAEIRDARGDVAGYAYAVTPVDASLLAELSAAAGATVVPLRSQSAGAVPLPTYLDQPLPLALAQTATPTPASRLPVVLVAGLVAAAGAALLGCWLASVATRPLRVLLDTVDQVSAGDLDARSRLSGRDETALLGTGLDRLIAGMQETRRLSVTDPLTGLGNVRSLADSLRLEIERASRFGRTLGILLMDLDHFKAVNDRHGHRAGDAVLVEFAQRVRGVVREVDLAFRQGGEEFVILLPETDVAGSLTAARRIGEAVRDVAFTVLGGNGNGWIPVTVSIGVAVYPRHALTAIDLLDAADQALYAAKDAGRDTFVLAAAAVPEQRVTAPERLVIESGGALVETPSTRVTPAG